MHHEVPVDFLLLAGTAPPRPSPSAEASRQAGRQAGSRQAGQQALHASLQTFSLQLVLPLRHASVLSSQ